MEQTLTTPFDMLHVSEYQLIQEVQSIFISQKAYNLFHRESGGSLV